VISIFFDSVELLLNMYEYRLYHPTHTFALACILTAVACQVRRYKALTDNERTVFVTTVGLTCTYIFLTGSNNRVYHIYFLPWLLLNFFIFLTKLIKKQWTLDKIDLFIFASLGLACVFSIKDLTWFLILVFTFIRLLDIRMVSRRIQIGGAIFVLLILVHNVEKTLIIVHSLPYLVTYRWFLSCCILGMPWLLIVEKSDGIAVRGFRPISINTLFVFLFLGIMGAYLFQDLMLSFKSIWPKYDKTQFKQLLSYCETKERILGPGQLWLYNPGMKMQNNRALMLPSYYGLFVNVPAAISQFNPDLNLWQAEYVPWLIKQYQRAGKGNVKIWQGPIWSTPFGLLQELKFQELESNS